MGSDVWILILLFLVVVIAIFTAWQVARGAQQRTNITNPREPDPFPDEGSRINFRPGLPTEEQIVERERLLHGEMIEREARREAERLVRVKKRTQKLLFWKEEREQKLRQDKAILQRKKAKERALLKRKTAKNASSAQDLRHGFRTSSDYEVLSQEGGILRIKRLNLSPQPNSVDKPKRKSESISCLRNWIRSRHFSIVLLSHATARTDSTSEFWRGC